MLEKTFDPSVVEPRLYAMWEKSGAFAPAGDGEGFSIVIPPPNVTGSLHMGHALNNTLQDVLARFERMRGKAVLWLPGTDHAGIATQMVVERQLAAAGNEGRRELGREKFIEKVWAWKAESGGTIVGQLRRLGASCDWSRERFTLDEGLSDAVRKVFVTLYKQGLMYRDKRLVNWDPHFQTAISDLEVEQKEVDGAYYHFAYPLADGVTYQHPVKDEEGNETFETRDYIVVATTRPETMLGDTGVAVHPDDERYKGLIGKFVTLPIVGRRIPIVADEYADPEKGSGAVKITPAHDFNDFQVGKRQGLDAINIMDVYGALNDVVPEDYRGLDRFVARKRIIAEMETLGLLKQIEKTKHMVPHGDRSGVVIEPYLTDQWYVNAGELAREAIKAVEDGRTVFEPRNWEKTYFEWMRNIEPWCVSRQLWWGHRIPAWYAEDGKVFVADNEAEAHEQAKAHYGKAVALRQDEDVLDTWFSSALWPFSTMGWPEETEDLRRFYPTHTLVTGFDIIFFWVARMMMMGLHFMKDEDGNPVEPFSTVYVHALVRDKNGQKMSKSKGNVIDPLDLIEEYGADALRFTLAIMAAQGRDVKLDPARIAGYRNFGTKLWNATRFAEMNGVKRDPHFLPEASVLNVNRWILTELSATITDVTAAIQSQRFNDAAASLYRFVWNQVCDWYLELLKPIFAGEDEAAKAEAQACVAYVLEETYKLLHPFMPFMTEELWAHTASRDGLLCHADWPVATFADEAAAAEINWLVDLVTGLRSARSEMNVPPSAKAPLIVVGATALTEGRLQRHDAAIKRLARVETIELADTAPRGAAQVVVGEATACLPLGSLIDLVAERARIEKSHAKTVAEIDRAEKKLGNEKFVANADPEVVAAERERLAELLVLKASLETALKRIDEAT